MQFFLYAAAYALTGVGYATFAAVQTRIASFLLGVIVAGILGAFTLRNLVTLAAAAVFVTGLNAFVMWHGSGMENAITHVLFLTVLFVIVGSVRREHISLMWIPVVFAATISRHDSVYHVAPLLVIWSGYWLVARRSPRALGFSFAVFLLWLGFHVWRYTYFGDVLPNTAYAQTISVSDRISLWMSSDESFLAASAELGAGILLEHGAFVAAALLPLLFHIRKERGQHLLLLLLFSLIVTSYFNPYLFGQTRLDPVRSTTQLALVSGLILAVVLARVRVNRQSVATAALAIPLVWLAGLSIPNEPAYLCCSTNGFDKVRRAFAQAAEAERLRRPTVSSPDLGVLSWHKQFNVVDLGRLGSPLMAKIPQGPLLSEYLFEWAAPDLLESHGSWSCQYRNTIFNDNRFRERYVAVREETTRTSICGDIPVLSGIWFRKAVTAAADTAERRLVDDLSRSLSTERLAAELASCRARSDGNCTYVARSAYRFLPEFRAHGMESGLQRLFSGPEANAYDRYLVNGYRNPRLHEDVLDLLIASYTGIAGKKPILENRFSVYLTDDSVVYLKSDCRPTDLEARFFLHLFPGEGAPSRDRANLNFNFGAFGHVVAGRCFAARPIPFADVARLQTGQFVKETGRIWQAEYRKAAESSGGPQGPDANTDPSHDGKQKLPVAE